MCNFSSLLLPLGGAGAGAAGGTVASAEDNSVANDGGQDDERTIDSAASDDGSKGNKSPSPDELSRQNADVTMPTLESLEPMETNG